MENFQEMADAFLSAGALVQVASAEALGQAMLELLGSEPRRRAVGEAARGLIDAQRGAAARTAERLAALVEATGAAAGAA
jgi:3-deoxy-D-manno-octulosonic-acid transferase